MPDVLLTDQTAQLLPAKMRFPGWQPMCMPSTYWKAFDSLPGWKYCFGDRISQDKTQLWQHLRFLYHHSHCQMAGLHSLWAAAHGSAPTELNLRIGQIVFTFLFFGRIRIHAAKARILFLKFISTPSEKPSDRSSDWRW